MAPRIHRRFLVEALLLDVERVRDAARSGEPVGSCDCGGYLYVDGPPARQRAGGPEWVALACRACGYEIAAPDGRLARPVRIPGGAAPRNAGRTWPDTQRDASTSLAG